MALTINKQERKSLEAALEQFQEAHGELDNACAQFNATVRGAFTTVVQTALNTANEARENFRQTLDDIVSRLDSERGDKSDRWAESERGESIGAWIDAMETIASNVSDDIAIDAPQDIEAPGDALAYAEEIEEHLDTP